MHCLVNEYHLLDTAVVTVIRSTQNVYALHCVYYVVGAEGKVDESLAVLAEVESLKTKKKEAEVRTCLVI